MPFSEKQNGKNHLKIFFFRTTGYLKPNLIQVSSKSQEIYFLLMVLFDIRHFGRHLLYGNRLLIIWRPPLHWSFIELIFQEKLFRGLFCSLQS